MRLGAARCVYVDAHLVAAPGFWESSTPNGGTWKLPVMGMGDTSLNGWLALTRRISFESVVQSQSSLEVN